MLSWSMCLPSVLTTVMVVFAQRFAIEENERKKMSYVDLPVVGMKREEKSRKTEKSDESEE